MKLIFLLSLFITDFHSSMHVQTLHTDPTITLEEARTHITERITTCLGKTNMVDKVYKFHIKVKLTHPGRIGTILLQGNVTPQIKEAIISAFESNDDCWKKVYAIQKTKKTVAIVASIVYFRTSNIGAIATAQRHFEKHKPMLDYNVTASDNNTPLTYLLSPIVILKLADA